VTLGIEILRAETSQRNQMLLCGLIAPFFQSLFSNVKYRISVATTLTGEK
jgi:hypothetical protein